MAGAAPFSVRALIGRNVTSTAASPGIGLAWKSAGLLVLSARMVALNWLVRCCLNSVVLTIPMISRNSAVTAI